MRALMIEDNPATAMIMELQLKSAGFIVQATDLGEEGIELAKIYDYDVITLDLNLPDISGLEVLRQLRAAKIMTPVLVLTGDTKVETKVKAFGRGADDYVTKPIHKDELVCRLHALIRRSKGHAEAVIKAGPIAIHVDQKTVEVHGKRVHFTSKEYQLLELFALRKGSTVSKEAILNHLYGGMDEPEAKIVDVYVSKTRKKLREAGAPDLIQCVWARGYVLVDPAPEAMAA